MTNGQPLVVRGAVKPIATLMQGMDSAKLKTRAAGRSDPERSDVCAVPAARVVGDNVVALKVACAWLEKFGGDTLSEIRPAYRYYLDRVRVLSSEGGSWQSAGHTETEAGGGAQTHRRPRFLV